MSFTRSPPVGSALQTKFVQSLSLFQPFQLFFPPTFQSTHYIPPTVKSLLDARAQIFSKVQVTRGSPGLYNAIQLQSLLPFSPNKYSIQ